ncbi:protein FAM83H [Synchiropus picturatus]
MAHRSQNSSMGENNPLHKDYLPPHYKEEYRLAIDALLESDTMGYHDFLRTADVVSFLAQPEIDYIKSTVQVPTRTTSYPDLTFNEGQNDADGSSDTYWPMQSDVAAPGLDLGWPTIPISGIGATEVTTLVNPSDPDMPSIKEQARRLIKNARQVIAIVMDMFTDVDIFADLLDAAARHVPVYILLDEHDSHHFLSMVMNCKVNLDLIPMMRVRSVPGITYYSRCGKTFKGQVKDRFLLVDCRAVLSGSYSFMWSYEKIHRCIAHLFLGELVASFDEEFRILYAQSEPLVIDPSHAVPDTSNYLSSQFGLKRSQSLRNPIGFRRQHELPSAFPYGDNAALPFRRNDPFRHTMEPGTGVTIGKYSQQQFRPQQSYIDQGRSIVSRPEMSGSTFKRHSYAEGTQENYTSSRQYMKHRVMNNLDETDFHRDQTQSSHFYSDGPGPGSGHGHYDRLRGYPSHLSIDQHSDSSFRSDRGPTAGNYGRPHFSSEDLSLPEGLLPPPVAGRYEGGHSNKRPTIGQPYTCLASPTQPHPPAKKPFSYERLETDPDQDDNAKQGLRNYRLNSYLSAYENYVEEGLNQQIGTDAFDDPLPSQDPTAAEGSSHYFGKRDQPMVPPKPRPDILKPRFGKPVTHDSTSFDSSLSKTTMDLLPSASILEKREKEAEKERERDGTREVGVDVGVKEAPELLLSKHESFRSRINPHLQRSSRLRSSLIFSSSKAEMHSGSLGMKPATEDDEELDLGRTTSIVSQILEKRRSITREPFQWRKKTEEKIQESEQEKPEKVEEKDEKPPEKVTQEKDGAETKMEYQKLKDVKSLTTSKADEDVSALPTVNMNDPASRLQYFKDLAAKRKVTKTETESKLRVTGPSEIKPEESKEPLKPQQTTTNPSVSNGSSEPERKKPDVASKLADLEKKETHGSSKPPLIPSKPQLSYLKPLEPSQTNKEENASDGHKKDIFKLKPLPSPKIFKKDPLKLKGLNPRRSCGEEILTGDATDAEKSEMKKIRSHSSSTLPREYAKEQKGSNTSINTLGTDGKSEGKTLDFLKKQTQKLKGMLGTKDKDKKTAAEDRGMSSVKELVEDYNKKQGTSTKDTGSASTEQTTANHKSSTPTSAPTRTYQSPTSSVIFSSNLRDDTKVILEQISANSQKNRQEREQETGADKDSDSGEKGLDRQNSIKRGRFLRPIGNVQEREGLLKRIESLRKEKKVYSRFEMGNSLG